MGGQPDAAEALQKLDAEFAKASPRLCKELNARDPTTVLGLATNLWPGARQAKVTGVMRERLLIGATGFSPIREELAYPCLLYTSPSPRDQRGARMPSSA